MISFSFFQLLQDEIPEIRIKMSKLLTKLLPKCILEDLDIKIAYNFNVIQEKFIENLTEIIIKNIEKYKCYAEDIYNFFLSFIFEGIFFKFKKTNHFEKKIFAFDKPNKFYDDFKLKKIFFINFKNILPLLSNSFKEEDFVSNFIMNSSFKVGIYILIKNSK